MSPREDQVSPPTFSQMVWGDGTPRKAVLTALVVGTILITINQGDLILAGIAPPAWKIILTYCVPYCVTTWGAITGKQAQWRRDAMSRDVAARGDGG